MEECGSLKRASKANAGLEEEVEKLRVVAEEVGSMRKAHKVMTEQVGVLLPSYAFGEVFPRTVLLEVAPPYFFVWTIIVLINHLGYTNPLFFYPDNCSIVIFLMELMNKIIGGYNRSRSSRSRTERRCCSGSGKLAI